MAVVVGSGVCDSVSIPMRRRGAQMYDNDSSHRLSVISNIGGDIVRERDVYCDKHSQWQVTLGKLASRRLLSAARSC
jgi:hypothetical protein